MAKTKVQKQEIISTVTKDLSGVNALLFADFTGTPVSELNQLRNGLRSAKTKMGVVKKRLLDQALKGKGVDVKAQEFAPGQLATIFVNGDMSEAAGPLYRFAKGKDNFKVLGGYDFSKNEVITAKNVLAIGQLPPRPIMLGQLLGTLIAPLRSFMYLVQEKGKRSSS